MSGSGRYDHSSLRGARDPERAAAIAREVAAGVRTLTDIGVDYGITKERVRQIAEREGVSRERRPLPARPRIGHRTPCRTCGQLVPTKGMRDHRIAAGHTTRFGGRLTGAHLGLIREFYERGLGYHVIAAALGVRHTLVVWHLTRMGVPRQVHRAGRHPQGSAVQRLRDELVARLLDIAA